MRLENQVAIYHQDETVAVAIKSIQLRVQQGYLNVEIETLSDERTSLGMGEPTLYIEEVLLSVQTLEELLFEEISVPVGWDTEEESKEDHIFRIYLHGHYALDNNKLTLRRVSPEAIELIWEADADDFCYYNEQAKRNAITVHAIYSLPS
jgi:hypothetical protein